ncbi:MAG: type VI secretion system accessory protein TagJ, partial [Rudaea sp.]
APADEKLRTYLFQLLALQGKWQRALEQLQMCGQLSAKALPMAQTYREAIRCEMLRADVFAGKRGPQILGEPPAWIGPLIESLQRLAKSDAEGARALRDAAFDAAPASAGTIDGTAFEWIADADSRLGPVCEAMINGQYYWVPFFRIRTLRIEPPADLRDLVWASAHLTLANGGEYIALVPARYPGSEAVDNDALKLARRTEWTDAGGEAYVGLGQKMMATDTGEHALLDVREIAMAS